MLTREQKAIYEQLVILGGAQSKEDDVLFEGTKYIIPASVPSVRRAAKTLNALADDLETETSFSRQYNYRPHDGAHAVALMIRSVFGFGISKPIRSFFGTQPPEMISIQVGVNETEQVPWGAITLPGLEDTTLYLGAYMNREYGPCFEVTINSPRKNRDAIEGVFAAIQHQLDTASIYRGKAIDGAVQPNFIDTRAFDPDDVVYSQEVMHQLEANVWSPIIHAEALAKLNQPAKRSVLLEGDYGTGKTLAALQTAQIAEDHGFTFIMCRPGVDNFLQCLQTARMYGPAVLFLEDVDTVSEAGESVDAVTRILDAFDGLKAKGQRLLLCLTTNHVHRIHKGMIRPGRLDAIIHFGEMDLPGVEKLARRVIGPALAETTDFERVFDATKGFMPAFVKEALDRSIRYSVARNDGELGKIDTEDLVLAANGLRRQLNIMNDASDLVPRMSVDAALGTVIEATVKGALSSTGISRDGGESLFARVVELDEDGDPIQV